MQLIIKSDNRYKITNPIELKSNKNKDFEPIGVLKKDYPSLNSLSLLKRDVPDFIEYLETSIKWYRKKLNFFIDQLEDFEFELKRIGIDKNVK